MAVLLKVGIKIRYEIRGDFITNELNSTFNNSRSDTQFLTLLHINGNHFQVTHFYRPKAYLEIDSRSCLL